MKLFREPVSSPDQLFLLPLCVDDFVAKDASVRIISEAIDTLDCSVLYAKYLGMGAPSYDPKMMFKLLVFGYREGIRSSRRLDAACGHDMRFMFLAQMSRPDFRTLARFRRSNEKEIETLFVQTVLLCMKVGMVLLEHVAVDGTKIEANVSGRATFNSERLEKEIANIETKITTILKEAEETDALEDEKHGDSGADDPPDGLKTMNDRKKTLEAARDSLKETGHKSVAVTDTQSRLMKTRSGNRPAYNAQAVVDNAYQVIIAASVTQDTFDSKQFAPMLEQAIANTGDLPCQTSADKGYYSVAALEYCEKMGLDAYIPASKTRALSSDYTYDETNDIFLGCTKSTEGLRLCFYRYRNNEGTMYKVYRDPGKKELHFRVDPAQQMKRQQQMQDKLSSPEGKKVYSLRQQTVEPVFGQIKSVSGFRRLLLRGLQGARIEYLLACCAHNLGKIVTS